MSRQTHINFLGQGSGLPVKINRFRKGSIESNEDPLFLTFFMDFDPSVGDLHPEPLAFNSLLSDMLDTDAALTERVNLEQVPTGFEISTLEYLKRAYNQTDGGPAKELRKFQTLLNNIYSASPWYFQTISGVSDLWKKATNVTDASKKVTLTIGCNESVDMKILQLADYYRKAIFDQRAMAYRVPDNLRKFAFDLYLFEIRNLKDFSAFSKNVSEFTNGAHYIKFKCKMCEFDFSETLQGGATAVDLKSFAEEKPFATTFKINIEWVSEDSFYQEAGAIALDTASPNFGIFQGAVNSVTSQINRKLTNLSRVPARVIGAVVNEIQNTVENVALGNAYSGRYDDIIRTGGITDAIGRVYQPRPRVAPIGPGSADPLGTTPGYGG
jgi:hypothetical protein